MKSFHSILLFWMLGTATATSSTRPSKCVDRDWGCKYDCNTSRYGSKNVTKTSGAFERWYLVHIPRYYDSKTPAGLIISYHGRGKTAQQQENLSRLSDHDYNPDWFVVYPQGLNSSWQGPAYSNDPPRDDLKFTEEILHDMRQAYNIDNSRIFATGKSNGGGFVGTLACNPVGSNFAAFAPVSGAFYTDASSTPGCTPAKAITPILEIHGLADTTIPYEGNATDKNGPVPPIPDWLERWASRNGCSGDELTPHKYSEDSKGEIVRTSWSCSGHKHLVQGITVKPLHHIWPSERCNCDNCNKPSLIEATEIIMEFFKNPLQPMKKTADNQESFLLTELR